MQANSSANIWLREDRQYGNGMEDLEEERDHADGRDNADGDNAEADVEGFLSYLESPHTTDAATAANANTNADTFNVHMDCEEPPRPVADALNNMYVRIVHTNGIHHLAMVTCLCQGEQNIPLDLVASRLLPASFTRIRTLFKMPLMDYFHLCNLELKASAYQFYQLICRLMRPIGDADIVNLYHKFRRMSQLWRWMKKLKWAGYGHNRQDPLQPAPG